MKGKESGLENVRNLKRNLGTLTVKCGTSREKSAGKPSRGRAQD